MLERKTMYFYSILYIDIFNQIQIKSSVEVNKRNIPEERLHDLTIETLLISSMNYNENKLPIDVKDHFCKNYDKIFIS